jgi:hypothetical protein
VNPFRSSTTRRFWECLNRLPVEIQDHTFKQYAFFEENPFHPSLQFKEKGRYWSVRVSRGYRALAVRHDNDLTWFWIGPHDEYERLLKS